VNYRSPAGVSIIRSGIVAFLTMFVFTAPADASSDIVAYKLAPGDRITVTVVGQPDLSGDFAVDGEGKISLPIVGPVEAGNLTASECQQRIVDRLSDGILNKPSVFVRITELRPVQIMGNVRAPGSLPYRYGIIVKGAIAQAGGLGLAERDSRAAISEFLLADERVRTLDATRRMLLVRQARLEAQIEGATTLKQPALPDGIDDLDNAKLIDAEGEVLSAERQDYEKQINLIQSQKPQLLSESDAMENQISIEKKQIELVQSEMDEYSKLVDKGLGRSSSMLELKLSIATKNSNVWRMEAERSRLKSAITDFDIRLQDMETLRKKQFLTELQDVRQRLHDVEVTLPSAREVRAVRLQQTGSSIDTDVVCNIRITRVHGAEVSTFKGDETTALQPGDIIEVTIPRSSTSRPPLAAVSSKDLVKFQNPPGAQKTN
jgi:polysaccharide biosynthesis/export protein